MISLENISIGFQERVLFDNLNWRIPRGSRIGLVGNNGTGKTTLFRTIVELVQPDKGNITLPPNQRIGYLPQDLNLDNHPPVVYPGSIERINFGEEKDDKGVCLVNIEKGKTSYEFIPLPARKFVTIDVVINQEQDPTNTLLEEIEKIDLSEAVVRVFYTMSSEKEGLLDFKRINSALEGAFLVSAIAKKYQSPERRKRVEEMTENLGMLEAMDKYIQNNSHLVPLSRELKTYAQELEKELEGNS